MACRAAARPLGAIIRRMPRRSGEPLSSATTAAARSLCPSTHSACKSPSGGSATASGAAAAAAGACTFGQASAHLQRANGLVLLRRSALPRPQQQQQQQQLALPSRSMLLRLGPLLLGSGTSLRASTARGLSPIAAAAMFRNAAAAGGPASPTGAIVVYVTVPSAEVGEGLASKVVEAKLAACVNMLPGVTSIYSWKGKVEKDAELLLIIKTREELLPQLTAFVRANHPYDEPEVIGLPILGGSSSYLQWLLDSTRAPEAAAEGSAVATDTA